MKTKATMKFIQARYKNVWRCGYADLQYIFERDDIAYYNAGTYGWNCDIIVDYRTNTAITTGYRNMRGRCIPSEIIKKYSDIAKQIKEKYVYYCEEYEAEMYENKRAFLNELFKIIAEEV